MHPMLVALSLISSTIDTRYGGTDCNPITWEVQVGGDLEFKVIFGKKRKRLECIRMVTSSMMGVEAVALWIAGT